MPGEFNVGDEVQDKNDRTFKGTILGPPERRYGRDSYWVQHEDGRQAKFPSIRLILAMPGNDLGILIRNMDPGGKKEFLRNYTFRKLVQPVDDTIYSLKASRTELHPYQLKPLRYFLDSTLRRFLIADEVGLGKTIEAGLIISELRARNKLGGVLILCPTPLVSQWQQEMLHRFDEEFEIVHTRSDWKRQVLEVEDTDQLRLIVGHKTIQDRGLLEMAVEEGVPTFDLMIVDEADVAKNTNTLIHKQIHHLADAANQVLLLTATPIQMQIQDLLSLLRILDMPTFENKDLFEMRLEANQFIVAATGHLRSIRDRREAVVAARGELVQISPLQQEMFALNENNRLGNICSRLQEIETDPGRTAIVEVISDLRNLNLLTPYLTRTRKVDVKVGAVRQVTAIKVGLGNAEKEFYDAVLKWMRERVAEEHGQRNYGFLIPNRERQLASCLHSYQHAFVTGTPLVVKNDDSEDDSEIRGLLDDPPAKLIELAKQLGSTDAKFQQLLELIQGLLNKDPSTKIIVFAWYRFTLTYLEKRLKEEGIGLEVIHGGIPLVPRDPRRDERGNNVKRFLEEKSCSVLLSSQVGGEGLNLQAASVVINYDLPWNPAKVEQRIGRIDRFGQKAPVVKIYNFMIENTIEERIFGRLYDRLNIFETTLGHFGEILGSIARELLDSHLSGELTPQEEDTLIEDAEFRIRQERQNVEEFLEKEHRYVAYDQDYADQLKGLVAQGKTVEPTEIARVCREIIKQNYDNSSLREDPEREGVFQLKLDFLLREEFKNKIMSKNRRVQQLFLGKFQCDQPGPVTFDGEIAEKDKDLMLLTSRHPFVRMLVEKSEGVGFHTFSAMTLEKEHTVIDESGFLTIFLAELTFDDTTRRYLLPIYLNRNATRYSTDEANRTVRLLIDKGESLPLEGGAFPEWAELDNPVAELEALLERAKAIARDELGNLSDRLQSAEEIRIAPRREEMRYRFRRRLQDNQDRTDAWSIWLDAGRILLVDGEDIVGEWMDENRDMPKEEKQIVIKKKITNLKAYRQKLENDFANEEARVERIPEVTLVHKEAGGVWVEVI